MIPLVMFVVGVAVLVIMAAPDHTTHKRKKEPPMSDLYYDPNPHPRDDRDLAQDAYDTSAEICDDAWEAAIDQRPEHLDEQIIAWYQGTTDYQTAIDDIHDGERPITPA